MPASSPSCGRDAVIRCHRGPGRCNRPATPAPAAAKPFGASREMDVLKPHAPTGARSELSRRVRDPSAATRIGPQNSSRPRATGSVDRELKQFVISAARCPTRRRASTAARSMRPPRPPPCPGTAAAATTRATHAGRRNRANSSTATAGRRIAIAPSTKTYVAPSGKRRASTSAHIPTPATAACSRQCPRGRSRSWRRRRTPARSHRVPRGFAIVRVRCAARSAPAAARDGWAAAVRIGSRRDESARFARR